MKKFTNEASNVVHDYLAGLSAAHGNILRYESEQRIVTRTDAGTRRKVALIAGGGSGCGKPF